MPTTTITNEHKLTVLSKYFYTDKLILNPDSEVIFYGSFSIKYSNPETAEARSEYNDRGVEINLEGEDSHIHIGEVVKANPTQAETGIIGDDNGLDSDSGLDF